MMAPSMKRGCVLAVALVLAVVSGSAWGAVTGLISGTVTDSQTKAPLSGANVLVVGLGVSTITDLQGRFVITDIPPGSYSVNVSMVGYVEAQVSDLTVVQGQATSIEVKLGPTVVEAAGARAKITAPRVALRRDVTAAEYVVTAADEQLTLSQPNDRYQFPGLVFSQPGVVPDNTLYPHIRGARANQVGYYLDGIPITEPNSNVFATNVVSIGLDRLELFTGGYPVEYGGFTGGIINQVVKRGDQMRGRMVDIGAGTPYNFGGLTYEAGDVTDRANWYYGLYTWHSNLNENLFTSSAPTVSDHIAKVIYDLNERDSVSVLSAHGYARYLFPFTRELTFDPGTATWDTKVPINDSDFGRQGHDIDGVTLNHRVSATAFWSARVSRLRHFVELELGDPENLFWQHRSERMLVGQLDYQQQVGSHRLGAGVWQLNSDNRNRYSVFGTQFSPFGLLDSVSNNDTRNTQAYLGDTWEIGHRLTLNLGGRYDKMTYERPNPGAGDLDLHQTSGRAGATYVVSPRVMVRSSYGRYVEFPRASLIAAEFQPHPSENPMFADLGLTWDMAFFPFFPAKPQIDRGRDLGVEWKADPNSLVTATWFHRDSRQMTQRWQGVLHDAEGNPITDANGNLIPSDRLPDFDPNAPIWFAGNGTGTSRGVELKLDRKMSRKLRGWLSYTRMEAKATSPQDNVYPFGFGALDLTDSASLAQEFPVDWNQRRTIAAAARCQMGKLTVNPWLIMGSGFPYGQSGLDAGGSDPAHVPNPDFNPDDPGSPEELVVPQNYLDPNDPSKGFRSPNAFQTGKNLTVSLNLAYEIGPQRQAYVQIFNVFGRDDVTSNVVFHPRTGAIIGRIVGSTVSYVPFSRTPPRFIAFGIRQEF